MSLEAYKVIHLFGIFLILISLGGMSLHVANGGTRDYPLRKMMAMSHGIGLLIALIAGFGMLARLQLMNAIPTWAFAKLAIWLVLGGLPALIYRKPALAKVFWGLIVLLATTAAFLAVFKPGA